MQRQKFTLVIGVFFLITSTAVFFMQAGCKRNGTESSSVQLVEKSDNPSGASDTGKQNSSDNSDDWSGTFDAGTRWTMTYKGVDFTFCYCPAGSFVMGSPENEEDRGYNESQHEVTLTQGFWMLETELTQEQWEVMGVKKEEECGFKGKNLPVENVSWDECNEYIAKMNESAPQGMIFSLPTEAQWEYACRAGTTTAYFWGDSLNGDKANCDGKSPYGTTEEGNGSGKTAPVKSYAPNPWGLYDMHGNVWEWCSDRFGDYPGGAVVDPAGATDTNASNRVIRSGSWGNGARDCRSAVRNYKDPTSRNSFAGFRLLFLE